MTDQPAVVLHHGDCLDLLPTLPRASVQLVVTSPPYAMMRASQYGGVAPEDYPAWWMEVMAGIDHVLAPGGSVVINWQAGRRNGAKLSWDVRSLVAMLDAGWVQRDEYCWDKMCPVPGRYRFAFACGWERVLHMTRAGEDPHAWHRERVRIFRMPDKSVRPDERRGDGGSGWQVNRHQSGGYQAPGGRQSSAAWHAADHGLRMGPGDDRHVEAYPTNVLRIAKHSVSSLPVGNHPAVFPPGLPIFYIRLLSEPGDTVLDPFAGSGTTLAAAVEEGRRAIGIEKHAPYYAFLADRFGVVQPNLFAP